MANVFYNRKDLTLVGCLSTDDKVIFEVNGTQITYTVKERFLTCNSVDNDEIFKLAKINKYTLAREIYGYDQREKATDWKGWPETRTGRASGHYDMVKAIYHIIETPNLINQDNKEKTMLKKLSKTLKRILSKPMQSLYKADWVNGDLELTEAGKKNLWAILLEKHEEELAKEADSLIAELKKVK